MTKHWVTLIALSVCGGMWVSGCEELPPTCGLGQGALFSSQTPIVLGVVGEPKDLELFSLVSGCGVPALIDVQVDVSTPSGKPVPVEVVSTSAELSLVRARVRLVPQEPGQYVVRAIFQPSLGASSVFLTSVEEDDEKVAVQETFPRVLDCDEGPFRTQQGAVLCQRRGVVTVFRQGAEVETFSGTALAVVGDVVWSHHPTDGLVRMTDVGTELRVDGKVDLPLVDQGMGDHTEDEAVRQSVGRLFDVRWTGTTLTPTEILDPNAPYASVLLIVEGQVRVPAWRLCSDSATCLGQAEVLAADSRWVWVSTNGSVGGAGGGSGAPPNLEGGVQRFERARLTEDLETVALPEAFDVIRWWRGQLSSEHPLTLVERATGRTLVVEGSPEEGGWRLYRRALWSATRDWLAFKGDTPNQVVFQARPRR